MCPGFCRDRLVRFDWWGAGHDTVEEGYFISDNPLAERQDIDASPWPDPQRPGCSTTPADVEAQGAEHFVVPNFGFALFERAWSLRGFEHFLMDLALDPVFAGRAARPDHRDPACAGPPLSCPRCRRGLLRRRLRRPEGPAVLPRDLAESDQAAARAAVCAVSGPRDCPSSCTRTARSADPARPGRDRADRAQPGAARGARATRCSREFGGTLAFYGGLHPDGAAPRHS